MADFNTPSGDLSPDSREDNVRSLLTLRASDGLGPVLIARLRSRFGTASNVLDRTVRELQTVEGIGLARARAITDSRSKANEKAARELDRARELGIRFVAEDDPEYPQLLRPLPDAPPLLYVRGSLESLRYPVAIVGSRRCSAHALEQAARFGEVLASSGLSVVSGGARGIDTAAHRGAIRGTGTTVAVLGCGLSHCYPPENAALFDRIAGEGDEPAAGAVISELPLDTPPVAENFPARNRIISGLSLGVLVIAAARRSGALITARLAVEEHNREVLALPGRVGEDSCAGSNELLRAGGAGLVLEPKDVIDQLEAAAHHLYRGTHAHRFEPQEPASEPKPESEAKPSRVIQPDLNQYQQAILAVLDEPRTVDELVHASGLQPAVIHSELTMLELSSIVVREGSRIRRS